MTVGRLCQRQVDLADANESVHLAGQRMGARNVGTLVVLDGDKKPVGILTDRDLAVRVVGHGDNPYEVKVDDVMTPYPETVAEDTPIEKALGIMRTRGVRRLLVVGGDQHLVGVVSLDDILVLLAKELAQVGHLVERSSPRSLAEA